jgi:hypothetical protein
MKGELAGETISAKTNTPSPFFKGGMIFHEVDGVLSAKHESLTSALYIGVPKLG